MVIIFEFFLLAILATVFARDKSSNFNRVNYHFFALSWKPKITARVAFTRTDDLILIRKHNNVPIEESDEGLC